MKTLDKKQGASRDELADRLDKARQHLEDAISEYNEQIELAWAKVEQAADLVNGVLEDARQFTGEIAADIRSFIDERSEKWQEGERGQAYEEWESEWENVSLDDVDLDQPELLDMPDVPEGQLLLDLPDEPQ